MSDTNIFQPLKRIEAKLDRLLGENKLGQMVATATMPDAMPDGIINPRKEKGRDGRFVRLIEENCPRGQEWLVDNLVIGWLTGSNMYGTNTPESDEDFVGVVIPPVDAKLGLLSFEEADLSSKSSGAGRRNTKDDIDIKLYSLDKFIKLAMECNPNIIEMLFAPERCVLYANEIGFELMRLREQLLSKRLAARFGGYANSQIHKLRVKKENMTGRTELVEKFGYDTKFLMHALRLMLEGIEFMKTGTLELPLRQAPYLRDVRNGAYTDLDVAVNVADKLKQDFNSAEATSVLPAKPDRNFWNAWLIEKLKEHYA